MPQGNQVEVLALGREAVTIAKRHQAIMRRLDEIDAESNDRVGMGDIVINNGIEYMVMGKPYVVAAEKNRDGTWSARQVYLKADWKLKVANDG